MIWVNFDCTGQLHDWSLNMHKQTGSIDIVLKLGNILLFYL